MGQELKAAEAPLEAEIGKDPANGGNKLKAAAPAEGAGQPRALPEDRLGPDGWPGQPESELKQWVAEEVPLPDGHKLMMTRGRCYLCSDWCKNISELIEKYYEKVIKGNSVFEKRLADLGDLEATQTDLLEEIRIFEKELMEANTPRRDIALENAGDLETGNSKFKTDKEFDQLNQELPAGAEIQTSGDEFWFYDSLIEEYIGIGKLDQDGFLTPAIYRKEFPTIFRGRQIAKSLRENFLIRGEKINGLKGLWSKPSDNLDELNKMLLDSQGELTVEQAASQVWTGLLAKEFGFHNVSISPEYTNLEPPISAIVIIYY